MTEQHPAAETTKTNVRHHAQVPAFQPAEQFRQTWIFTAPIDHTIEDMLRPEYWMHVADKLRHYAHVECYAEDGTFYAEFLVVGKTANTARMALLNKVDLRAVTEPIDMAKELEAYVIRYAGPTNGFNVVRRADGRIMRGGLLTEQEARTWLLNFVAQPSKGFVEDRPDSKPIGAIAQPTAPMKAPRSQAQMDSATKLAEAARERRAAHAREKAGASI
jgi:hypothetical protein